jgi:COP9 signalosome complex subunit 4
VVAFEEQVSVIRVDLAKVYEEDEEWREAAKILTAIPLDTSQRYVVLHSSLLSRPYITCRVLDPEYKVNIYVKIAQLYLEDDESVQAEAYINRGTKCHTS